MLNQEMVVLSDGRPGVPSLWLVLDQPIEKSALDVARGGRTECVGFGNGELLFGRTGNAALAWAAVVKIVLIHQWLPKLLFTGQEFDLPHVVHLPFTTPYARSVFAVL